MDKAKKWEEIQRDHPKIAEFVVNVESVFPVASRTTAGPRNTKINKISLTSFDYVNSQLSTEEIYKPTLHYVKPFVKE